MVLWQQFPLDMMTGRTTLSIRDHSLILGSPLICFSKLSFLTDSVPSIQILLNRFHIFNAICIFWANNTFDALTFPSEISKMSTLHFKNFFTVFNFAMLLLNKSNWYCRNLKFVTFYSYLWSILSAISKRKKFFSSKDQIWKIHKLSGIFLCS